MPKCDLDPELPSGVFSQIVEEYEKVTGRRMIIFWSMKVEDDNLVSGAALTDGIPYGKVSTMAFGSLGYVIHRFDKKD